MFSGGARELHKHRNRGNITDLLINETLSRVAGSHKDNDCATQHVAAQPAPLQRAAGHAILHSSSAFADPTDSCHRLLRKRLLGITPATTTSASHRRHRGEQVERWRQRRALQNLRSLVHAQALWQAAQQRAAHEVAVQACLPQRLPPQLVVLHRRNCVRSGPAFSMRRNTGKRVPPLTMQASAPSPRPPAACMG